MGAGGFKPIVTDGLIYHFDGANKLCVKDSVTMRDIVQQREVDLIGGALFSDKGIDFDGVNDKVDILAGGAIPLGASERPYTLSVWVKEDRNVFDAFIVGRSSGLGVVRIVRNSALAAANQVNVSALIGMITGGTSFSANISNFNVRDWLNIVYTAPADAANAELFVNGVSVFNSNATAYASDSVNKIYLLGGLDLGSSSFDLNGEIGALSIWNKILTAAEILENYNSQKHRFD